MAYSAPLAHVDELLWLLTATTIMSPRDTGESLSPGLSRATSLQTQLHPHIQEHTGKSSMTYESNRQLNKQDTDGMLLGNKNNWFITTTNNKLAFQQVRFEFSYQVQQDTFCFCFPYTRVPTPHMARRCSKQGEEEKKKRKKELLPGCFHQQSEPVGRWWWWW